ncbi:hypothetical protein CKO28_12715 [Rhodovibrio sodomensis]|uniref:Uncharacterized protein n=1 Tax=Rhodovibrio sodomensis TaxID=1088 RepID=A0ABS1DF90_9PROT|nr:hypothetical protein [Rhodovibrio sodomensis]MBK1668893.1 hypothetical protein [Rhodovibrio sodomensis]
MTDCGSDQTCHPAGPLDAEGLLTLAVLMAVDGGPLSGSAIAARVRRLAAPGFDTDHNRVGAAVERLHADGYLDADGLDPAGEVTWRIAGPGRELATELGGRAPGQACDATRTCLLLRLCLDGTMPEPNRRVLVASLLRQASGAGPAQLPQSR